MKTLYKPFLPALAIFGLLLGCGGDKDTKEESGDGSGAQEGGGTGGQGDGNSGTQGGGDEKVTLAKFLPGKRLYVEVDMSQMGGPGGAGGSGENEGEGETKEGRGSSGPPEPSEAKSEDSGEGSSEDPSEEKGETPIFAAGGGPPQMMQFVLQFEKDGKFNPGMNRGGKTVSMKDGLTYKVSGPMKVTIFEDGKVDGGLTFPTAHPKKGDKIKFGPDERQMPGTITKIEDASPMESEPRGGGRPDEPAPEPGPGGEGDEATPVDEKKK